VYLFILQKLYKGKPEKHTQRCKTKMANVVVSLSGGKDSVYALYTALKQGLNVTHLMFISTGGKGHLENKWLIKLLSEAIGVPAVVVGKKPDDIRKALKKLNADMLVSGVMTTPEHLDYYKEILDPIGVKQYAPLFGKEPLESLAEMQRLGFHNLIIEIDTALGANKDWLGKEIDQNILDEITTRVKEKKINPIGEWGEYHTLVVDCPIFKKKIVVEKAKTEWKNTKGYYIIKKAELQPKA
jgi:diphthine-ammonia ligase